MMDTSKDIYPSPEDIGSVEKILNFSQSHYVSFIRKMFVEKSNKLRLPLLDKQLSKQLDQESLLHLSK